MHGTIDCPSARCRSLHHAQERGLNKCTGLARKRSAAQAASHPLTLASALPSPQAEVAPQLLGDVLALLAPLAHGGYLAPRCSNLALQFVTAAVDEKAPYKALKPHLDGLMTHVVLPMLAFDDSDAELWQDDPAEYVRKVRQAYMSGHLCAWCLGPRASDSTARRHAIALCRR